MYNNSFKKFAAIAAVAMLSASGIFWGCRDKGGTTDIASKPLEKLTLKLHWIPDAHQLGFWVALDKGLYRQQGVDASIYPGGMDANPIRDVLNGSADIGQFGGIEQVVLAAGEGLPVKAIAAIHRRSPHALISMEDRPIENEADFKGKTIAVAFGDTAEILLKAYLDRQGVPASSVNLVPFRYDLTPLLSGQVDAVTGFSTAQPVTIKEKGRVPHVLSYDSVGVKSYGYTLVASAKIMPDKVPALRAFLTASREGWKYTFAHPEEAAQLLKTRFGESIDLERTKAELSLIRTLMLDEKGELADWKIDATLVDGVKTMLERYSGLKEGVPAGQVFDNSYLNE